MRGWWADGASPLVEAAAAAVARVRALVGPEEPLDYSPITQGGNGHRRRSEGILPFAKGNEKIEEWVMRRKVREYHDVATSKGPSPPHTGPQHGDNLPKQQRSYEKRDFFLGFYFVVSKTMSTKTRKRWKFD